MIESVITSMSLRKRLRSQLRKLIADQPWPVLLNWRLSESQLIPRVQGETRQRLRQMSTLKPG
jgi:hypothetical protein